MSKKLIYGGKEVTANDPRLPEILANIVELVLNTTEPVYELVFGADGQKIHKLISPDKCILIDDSNVMSGFVDKHLDNGPASVFEYKGTYYPNHKGCTVADCLNQPGFKVEDDD